MKLLMKLTLILLLVFGAGSAIISLLTYRFLQANARREVLEKAQLMMASARSVRDYTNSHIKPLLKEHPEHAKHFLPETVPAFGAIATFKDLRHDYPDYGYREASLNPTNPEDRASDWEADILRYFREHIQDQETKGERETPNGPVLYLAKPMIAGPQCMECHSVPARCPRAMVIKYGGNNGFNWVEGSVVAAQIVTVPTTVAEQSATRGFHIIIFNLLLALMGAIVAIDMAVYFFVVRRLKLVSNAVDRVSRGEMDAEPMPVQRKR
jgi:hypothetical protein